MFVNKTVTLLAELYSKIQNGTATVEEKAYYDARIAISCIREDVLIKAIKQRAEELKTENKH